MGRFELGVWFFKEETTVKRVSVISYGGGMEVHQRRKDLSMIVCGT